MAKILLVEDDTNLSEIYQARMEAEGYTVVSASDGEAALAVAAKEHPDLIISDVMMPKISGFEMLDILRNTAGLKETPVIMLTALGQADDKTRADQLGADRYLVKSQVTLEDIVNAAHALLEGDGGQGGQSAAAAPTTTTTDDDSDDSATANDYENNDSTPPAAAEKPAAATEPAPQPVQAITVKPTPEEAAAATPAAAAEPIELTSATVQLNESSAPTPEPEPEVVTGGPGVTVTPTPANDDSAAEPHKTAAPLDGAVIDDHVVSNSVDKLLNTEPVAPATSKTGAVAGQRVIQPPAATSAPSLDELLAKEVEREKSAQQPQQPQTQPAQAAAPATKPAEPKTDKPGGVDPNSIAL